MTKIRPEFTTIPSWGDAALNPGEPKDLNTSLVRQIVKVLQSERKAKNAT
jgi:hypothetical protein